METRPTNFSRQDFLQYSFMGAAGLLLPSFSAAQTQQDKPAPLKPEIVKEFVGVSHGKFDRCKEMLENDILLLHSSHDLGGGDFESGIEAAGHVGNKEIANYLLSKGARYNIFLASMFDHIEVVKQVLTFNHGLLLAVLPAFCGVGSQNGSMGQPVASFLVIFVYTGVFCFLCCLGVDFQ